MHASALRVVVCHGEGTNFGILEEDGLRRPYHIVTMDELWWEAAAEFDLPRMFFRDKLVMMQFCLGNEILAVIVKDGQEETASVGASLYAMGAIMFDIYP